MRNEEFNKLNTLYHCRAAFSPLSPKCTLTTKREGKGKKENQASRPIEEHTTSVGNSLKFGSGLIRSPLR